MSTLVRNTVIATAILVGGMGAQFSPVAKEMKRRGQAAWSSFKLANVGHAALVYAADNDDFLPYAPGNFAFSVAYIRNKSCDAIPGMEGQCKPANVLLQGYGADYASFRSPADQYEDQPADKPKSWFEATTTSVAQGSSYEYWWSPSLTAAPTHEQKDANRTPLFVSLFTVPGNNREEYQVCYADGHMGAMSRREFENPEATSPKD